MSSWETVAGYRLTGESRRSELGTWHVALAPDGSRAGALRLTMGLYPAGTDRLAKLIAHQRALALPGLLPLAGLTVEHGQAWLIATRPATPTLADFLGSGEALDTGDVAIVLADSARALLALHGAGLTHGALDPGTVIIDTDGTAMLAEAGLAVELLGEPRNPAADVLAWSRITRALAEAWPGAAVLGQCAEVAEVHGLGAALDALPLLAPAPGQSRIASAAWRHTEPANDQTEPYVTFGPGVPERPAGDRATEIWKQGKAPKRTSRRGARVMLALGAALTLLLAFVVWWLLRGPALTVTAAHVDAPDKPLGCDSTARLVGVVTTNGGAGEFRYEWRHGAERKSGTQSAARGSRTARVELLWKIGGPGEFTGEATFLVLSPTPGGRPLEAKASFEYRC